MKAAVADWIAAANRIRLSDGVRGDVVNIAIRELCRTLDTPWNEITDTFDTVAGTRDYTLPANWSRPYMVWYAHPTTGAKVRIEYLDKDVFDTTYPDATKESLPGHFTVWGSTLSLGKTPDRVLTISRDYYAVLADLSADADVNGFTTNAWEAVLYKALAEASRYLIEDSRIESWLSKARELENELAVTSARARSSGRRPESQEP